MTYVAAARIRKITRTIRVIFLLESFSRIATLKLPDGVSAQLPCNTHPIIAFCPVAQVNTMEAKHRRALRVAVSHYLTNDSPYWEHLSDGYPYANSYALGTIISLAAYNPGSYCGAQGHATHQTTVCFR